MGFPVTSPVVVGRSRELAQLAAALAAAGEGRATTVLVEASSGLGASRIIAEAERRFADESRQLLVLRGRARPATRGEAYGPVILALRSLFERLSDASLPGLVGPLGDEIARLLPDQRDRLERLGALPRRPTTTAPIRAQGRTMEAVLGLLGRLSERQPVLLTLEDLHSADAATRALVSFVASVTRDQRLCVIGSYQADQLVRGHPLAADLAALTEATRPPLRIGLSPMSRGELGELIAHLEGERPSASVLLLVAERSGGSPLVTEELLAARRELSSGSLRGSLERLILARLTRRSPDCRETLRILAPAGRPITTDEINAIAAAERAIAGADPRRGRRVPEAAGHTLPQWIAAGIEEALEHGILRRIDQDSASIGTAMGARSLARRARGATGRAAAGRAAAGRPEALEFRHELIEDAVLHDVPPWQRRRLHAAMAGVFPASSAQAFHRLAARDSASAFRASLRAADEADALHAPEVSLEHLDTALELLPNDAEFVPGFRAADPGRSTGLLELELRFADVAFAAGRPGRAADYAMAALGRVDPRREPVVAGLIHERIGRFRRESGDLAGALQAFREAVRLIPPSEAMDRATALSSLAHVEMLEGSFADAEEHGQAAVAAARAAGPIARGREAQALTTLGVIRGWGDDPEAGIALLGEARALAEETGELDELFRVYANLTTVLDLTGRRDEAIAVAYEGIEAARRAGQEAVYGNFLRGNASESLFRIGRWKESAALGETALEWSLAGVNFVIAALSLAEVEIESTAGDAASRLLGRLLVELETASHPQYSVPTYIAAASLASWRDDLPDAMRAADQGWALVNGNDDWVLVARMAAAWTEIAAGMGGRTGQRRASTTAASLRRRAPSIVGEAEAAVAKAGVRGALGSRREADAHLATARAFMARLEGNDHPETWAAVADAWAEVGDPYQVAQMRRRQAEAALVGSDARVARVAARPALLAAATIASELGALPLLRELHELAGRALISRQDLPPLPVEEPTVPAEDETGAASAAARGQAPRLTLVQGGPAAPSDGDAFGLSPRERDVLALIARGRTNREIGTELFISEKTVGVHVGRVLAKLAVSGRVEAAMVAIRLGLSNPA